MQALQRVHRSRSIGLLRPAPVSQLASKAPSQPLSAASRPLWTGQARSAGCAAAPSPGALPVSSTVTSNCMAARRSAQGSARCAGPSTSTVPSER